MNFLIMVEALHSLLTVDLNFKLLGHNQLWGLGMFLTHVLVEHLQAVGFDGLCYPTDIKTSSAQTLIPKIDPNFYRSRVYILYRLRNDG